MGKAIVIGLNYALHSTLQLYPAMHYSIWVCTTPYLSQKRFSVEKIFSRSTYIDQIRLTLLCLVMASMQWLYTITTLQEGSRTLILTVSRQRPSFMQGSYCKTFSIFC